jgi:UDPglucose 6-dehydrogenase
MKKPVIGYAGMTHLGLNSAVAGAEKGFSIACYDSDVKRIAALNEGRLHVKEPNLAELLSKNAARISFTSDASRLSECDVVYVAPDVATDDKGQSDLSEINQIIADVESLLPPEVLVVILSQVPPGFTRALPRDKSRLFYQVETLIFGRAIERALYPERYIIGCVNPAESLPEALRVYLASFDCPILPMRYESAELAKISINMCLVASVSVANTLAELCERIGADWSEIVPALKLDKRIGQHAYLSPGLGIAGGNLERDLATVCNFADRYGTDAGVVRAWISNSGHRKDWPWRMLREHLLDENPASRIAVLGLAYKQDTHSTKNSSALQLLSHLKGMDVRVYDPVVPALAAGVDVTESVSALDAVQEADVVCLMTPWAEFKTLTAADLASRMRGRLVIDPYALLDAGEARAAGLTHVSLGVAPTPVAIPC